MSLIGKMVTFPVEGFGTMLGTVVGGDGYNYEIELSMQYPLPNVRVPHGMVKEVKSESISKGFDCGIEED